MKKVLVVLCCVGALALVGCGDKETPETFGQKYIEKKFENLNVDLLDLDYTVTETDEDAATVVIEGKIKYKEEITLVKKDDKWVIGKKEAKKADAVKKEVKKEEKAEAHAKPAKKEAAAEKAHH